MDTHFADSYKFAIKDGEVFHNRSYKEDLTFADRVIHGLPLDYTCWLELTTPEYTVTTYHLPTGIDKPVSKLIPDCKYHSTRCPIDVKKQANQKAKLRKTDKRHHKKLFRINQNILLSKKAKKDLIKRKDQIILKKRDGKVLETLPLDFESWDEYFDNDFHWYFSGYDDWSYDQDDDWSYDSFNYVPDRSDFIRGYDTESDYGYDSDY